MEWNFDNERPIYKQLVEALERRIVLGIYPLGERLPSVRDLADSAKVNPNTMQRALQELEELGYIYTERTNGKYVTKDSLILEAKKEAMAKACVKDYFEAMAKIGFSTKDAIRYLKERKEGEER